MCFCNGGVRCAKIVSVSLYTFVKWDRSQLVGLKHFASQSLTKVISTFTSHTTSAKPKLIKEPIGFVSNFLAFYLF